MTYTYRLYYLRQYAATLDFTKPNVAEHFREFGYGLNIARHDVEKLITRNLEQGSFYV